MSLVDIFLADHIAKLWIRLLAGIEPKMLHRLCFTHATGQESDFSQSQECAIRGTSTSLERSAMTGKMSSRNSSRQPASTLVQLQESHARWLLSLTYGTSLKPDFTQTEKGMGAAILFQKDGELGWLGEDLLNDALCFISLSDRQRCLCCDHVHPTQYTELPWTPNNTRNTKRANKITHTRTRPTHRKRRVRARLFESTSAKLQKCLPAIGA